MKTNQRKLAAQCLRAAAVRCHYTGEDCWSALDGVFDADSYQRARMALIWTVSGKRNDDVLALLFATEMVERP